MGLDQRAVLKAYPNVQGVDDTKAWDANGDEVTIDQSLVDAARVELDKLKYKSQRTQPPILGISSTYPLITEQLDQLYHDIEAGKFGADAKTGEWFVGITSVKTTYPKP